MMLYKNMKVKVYSPDGDSDFFDIVAGILRGNTLASYLLIICLDYILKMSIDLMKVEKKKKCRWYPTQTFTDADYAVLLANTLAQAKSPLHSLEQAAGYFGLHVNTDKMKYMCFNQKGDISTLNGDSLKLVDMFTYLRSQPELFPPGSVTYIYFFINSSTLIDHCCVVLQ